MKILCCEEHVELALDVMVDESETFPTLEKTGEDEISTCEYCDNKSVYIVGN
ncbi:CxxH/CxxC protein [Priestia koreensis]|uniref:CxxH/CxxC protein n=1 Tax=Priestia koreensis TaxID=284581 RepID=UPI0009FAEE25|nr:CxxH/CxxC protein [Priestia koreensis]MCM3006541.1 CxxH/CxxC protein [Priestia koreensis]UNL85011.1 CxxH/CxxC protein [Priestia koreensis]